jgi:hypothetical protein
MERSDRNLRRPSRRQRLDRDKLGKAGVAAVEIQVQLGFIPDPELAADDESSGYEPVAIAGAFHGVDGLVGFGIGHGAIAVQEANASSNAIRRREALCG